MQKIFKRFLSLGLTVAMCFGISAVVNTATESYVTAEAATTATASTASSSYYSSITATSGNQLLGQLHDLITTTHTKYSSYGDCKTKGVITDPGKGSNTVLEFYTHIDIANGKWDVSGGWNREHVWAKSLSGGLWETSGGGSDLHHIRPAEKDLNNHRGNLKYGEVGTSGTKEYTSVSNVLGGYSNSSSFEPLDNVKGDVARILMYMYTHYNSYVNVGGTTNGNGGAKFGKLSYTQIVSKGSEDAAKEMLLKWNKLDPVDSIETLRNEEVYKIQGNRNPFIDNSSYADAIWGGGTATPGPDTPTPPPVDPEVTLTGLTLNATALTLNAGKTYDLTVKPTPSNASASVGWSSSDEAVATVANGKITAKAEGTATITATSTVNSAIKAQAIVTVLPVASTGLEKATITISSFPNISAKYDYYNWEADGISGTAYVYDGGCMQFNNNKGKTSYFIASSTPTNGAIKSITVKSTNNGKTDRNWQLLTSTTGYTGITSGNPTEGNDRGTKLVTPSGVTWTVDGNDTCFALIYSPGTTTGAAYLESIEVEYGEKDTEVTPPALESIAINPSVFTLEEGGSTKLSVVSVPSTITPEVEWTSSDTSVATVAQDGTVTAVAAGNAEIFAIVKGQPEISAKAAVTVTAKAVEPEKPDPEKPDPEKPDPENPDSAKLEAFHNAVAEIPASGALSARLTKINAAITAYRALTAAEKTAAAEDVAALQQAIKVYNLAVDAYNQAAADAEEGAINGAGNFFKRGE